jgi:hypothetical protein
MHSMAEILRTIQTTAPREVSGGWTAERYEYQRNFSILLILELHERRTDYRVLLDYFDDVVVLNHSTSPTKARFYQIKTREDRPWRMTDLTALNKGLKPRSIIGKMYANFMTFAPNVDGIVFVTNAAFCFRLAGGETSGTQILRIAAIELSGVEHGRITNALDNDFPTSRPDHKPLLEFQRCRLNVLGQREQVIGRLNEFFHNQGGAEHVPIRQVYDSLLSEVSRKSGPFCGFGLGGMDEFYQSKTIARPQIADLFLTASTARRLDKYWDEIADELKDAGHPTLDRINIEALAYGYIGERVAGKSLASTFAAFANWLIAAERPNLLVVRSILGRVKILEPQCTTYEHCPYTGLPLRAALLVHVLEDAADDHVEHSGAEAAA